MATKGKINPLLEKIVEKTPPTSPAPTSKDITYLKGLKRRGYNEEEIFKIGKQVFPNLKIEQLKTNGGRPAGSTNKPKTTA